MRATARSLLILIGAAASTACPHDFTRDRRPADRAVADRQAADRPPAPERDLAGVPDLPPRPDVNCPSPCVNTVAGSCGKLGNLDGPVSVARFNLPMGLALEPDQKLLVADTYNYKIRRIDLGRGEVETVAGLGVPGNKDGSVAVAAFRDPRGVVVDSDGSIVVAEGGGNKLRRIKDQNVATIAGDGWNDEIDGPALEASLTHPRALLPHPTLGLLIADCTGVRIRILKDGQLKTYAGTTSGVTDGPLAVAKLHAPCGLAMDPGGKVFVADTYNDRVRVIENGAVSTLAGSVHGHRDGDLAVALFDDPMGLAVDAAGGLLVADYSNHCIRRIHGGKVTTVAGQPNVPGYLDGAPLQSRYFYPSDIVVDRASGTIYVADSNNHCIRAIR